MELSRMFAPMSISASGMAAERMRMEIIANNIANAQATKGVNGETFRRQELIVASGSGISDRDQTGVHVVEVANDPSPFQRVYMPGHPEADTDGYVEMPNVSLPREMTQLLIAMRTYEANLKAAQTYKQINEQALALLRGM